MALTGHEIDTSEKFKAGWNIARMEYQAGKVPHIERVPADMDEDTKQGYVAAVAWYNSTQNVPPNPVQPPHTRPGEQVSKNAVNDPPNPSESAQTQASRLG